MKKRFISVVLILAMALTMLPLTVFNASAAGLKTSADGIKLIKELEGFVRYPTADNGHYAIGWGTRCPDEDLNRYRANGITDAEAEALMKTHITSYETALDRFMSDNGVKLNQHQYDALICFTYNLGVGWMRDTNSLFRQYVIKGATGNDFIYAITRWCTASGEILPHLVSRRLAEANLYINGVYNKRPPDNYKYVLFDNNMDNASNDVRIQGFDSKLTTSVRATATKNGYQFMGWYTRKDGGNWITELNSSTVTGTLYGHWQEKDGGVDASGKIVGTPANYKHFIISEVAQDVRETPSASAKKTGTLKISDEVTITAEYMDASNVKWGKLSSGGWINLSGTSSAKTDIGSAIAIDPTELTVLKDVAFRLDAGMDFEQLGTLKKGEKITINYVRKVGNYTWGKFANGWTCLDYTNYQAVIAEANGGNVITATGVVKVNDYLRVRSGPGTDYPEVGTLKNGTNVTITAQKKVATNTWGLSEYGWICLYYVKLTAASGTETRPAETTPAETTAPTTAPAEPTTAPTETTRPTETTGAASGVIMKGVVYNCDTLRVRANAGTNYAQVGGIARGTHVEILEKKSVNGQPWGRIDKGWICLSYVKEDGTAAETGNATVYNCSGLNVRSQPGAGNAKVGYLRPGTKVTILEQTTVAGKKWGRINLGWVFMDYIKMDDNSGTTPSETTPPAATQPADGSSASGTVVNCNALRVRSGAGLQYPQVGSVAKNTKVTFSEITTVGKAKWGNIGSGWISLDYVKLDDAAGSGTGVTNPTTATTPTTPAASGSKTGKVVNCETLRVRSGAGLQYPQVGSLKKNTKVTITETAVVGKATWGKIGTGWICLDYVQLDHAGTGSGTTPTEGTKPTTSTTPTTSTGNSTSVKLTGVIENSDVVRVRSGAGVNYPQTGTVKRGSAVTITEVQVVGFSTWGKTGTGWICLDYVKLDAGPAVDAAGIRMVNTDRLIVRSEAKTSAKQVGYYSRNTKVIILEQTTVDGKSWGRTANGWISLEYVK